MTKKLRSELLVPAGSLDKLKIAILYGADAIYMGTPDLSLRTKSDVTLEQLVEAAEYTHKYGKKLYLTLNLFSHNKDIEKLPVFIKTIKKVKPDGVIIADPGVFAYVKENAPELEIHISTQANVCSWLSVNYWKDQGASLCVMAREVSFEELTEIRKKCPDIKLETFIHGAMCMTYSGRCLLSNFMAERGANQGNCAHSCRWNYKLHLRLRDGTIQELEINENNQDMFEFLIEEEIRPGELMPIEEDSKGSYILNAKDLCLMPKLDQYLELGIDSLKIEGRNKSEYYVALVTKTYRQAMDDWHKDKKNWDSKKYIKELDALANRGYSLAFHEGRLTNLAHNYDSAKSASQYEFCGMITEIDDDSFVVEVKNRLVAGDVLEFIVPNQEKPILLRIYEFIKISRKGENKKKFFRRGEKDDLFVKEPSEEAKKVIRDDEVVVKRINPGFRPIIRIPFALFDQEDPKYIKKSLQKYVVMKKEKALSETEIARLKLDLEARKLEQKRGGSEKKYQEKKETLQSAINDNLKIKTPKTPRIGEEGCCGKGCNGCLMFWNDEKYEQARELMAKKKIGEML